MMPVSSHDQPNGAQGFKERKAVPIPGIAGAIKMINEKHFFPAIDAAAQRNPAHVEAATPQGQAAHREETLSGRVTKSLHGGSLPKNKADSPAQFISGKEGDAICTQPFATAINAGLEVGRSTSNGAALSSTPNAAPVGSDEWMRAQGAVPMTAAESKEHRKHFECSEVSELDHPRAMPAPSDHAPNPEALPFLAASRAIVEYATNKKLELETQSQRPANQASTDSRREPK
jgi:hypothetical protein